MSNIVDSLSDYIRAGFDPHNQLKEARGEIKRLNAENARLREALEGVIRIADRDCPEFRAARAALAGKEEKC